MAIVSSSQISQLHNRSNTEISNSQLRHNQHIDCCDGHKNMPEFHSKISLSSTVSPHINRQVTDVFEKNQFCNTFHAILMRARYMLNEAVKNKMIFTIHGPYDRIRRDLLERGWIEKKVDDKTSNNSHEKSKSSNADLFPKISGDIPAIPNSKNDQTQELPFDKFINIEELKDIASQLAFNCIPDFIWTLRLGQIDMKIIKPNQIINHFKKSGSFTTKTGLIKSFNSLRWFEKDPDDVFPRSFIISNDAEKKAFLNDYYLTACVSMLRLTADVKEVIHEKSETESKNIYYDLIKDSNNSKCPIKKVVPLINYDSKEVGESQHLIDRRYPEMAISYCQSYFKSLENKDLDTKELVFCSNKKWEKFFENFWNVTFEGYGIQCTESSRTKCRQLCKEFQKIHPQYNLNGTKNIWIVKPGAKSRGRGISCISKYSELSSILRSHNDALIVQKYIERPLLVYNTKFDIRQWFLVTSWSPLIIWWYNDSYIRFCSQQFTLNDFNEAVHLSNNSIQYKYQNGPRSEYLPTNNMWDWVTFEQYLNDNGYENSWKKDILPSMKNIIIDILLCSQEEIEDRKNSFELYGADFMITEGDLKTWLIEINSSPCMASSTEVTARLTKSVLEDVLKVVLDYSKNMYCDTGQFELLYKQEPFSDPLVGKYNELSVVGNGVKKPVTYFQAYRESVNDRKIVYDESSILKNKLRQIIGNSEMRQSNMKLEDYVGKQYGRAYNRFNQQCTTKEYLNELINNRHKRSISQDHITKIYCCEYLKNAVSTNLTNYPNVSVQKWVRSKEEKIDKILPIIQSTISDKQNPKKKRHITDKYICVSPFIENSTTSKMNLIKNNETKNKRIDQLIKAYKPNLVSM